MQKYRQERQNIALERRAHDESPERLMQKAYRKVYWQASQTGCTVTHFVAARLLIQSWGVLSSFCQFLAEEV